MSKFIFVCLTLIMSPSLFAALGTVQKIHGKVLIDGKEAKVEQKIEAKSRVEAQDKKSFVMISFFNGSRILLRNGVINFEGSQGKESVIELASGELFSYVRENLSLSQKVKTKNAVMGVRGTKFYVKESPEESYLCVCEGKVEIKNSKSTAMVSKNEDVHAKKDEAFNKSGANKMMMDMAWDGFAQMGFEK
jgi:hypothetical protein